MAGSSSMGQFYNVLECMNYNADCLLVFKSDDGAQNFKSSSSRSSGAGSAVAQAAAADASEYEACNTATCHANILSMSSSVLRSVIEAAGDVSKSSHTDCMKVTIALPGTSKQQWMQIAPFLYPPAADVAEAVVDWDNLEAVLVLGHKYDMKGLLRKGSDYLKENVSCMVGDDSSNMFVWKWLRLTACLGLTEPLDECIQQMASLYCHQRVVKEHIEGLPAGIYMRLMLQACEWSVSSQATTVPPVMRRKSVPKKRSAEFLYSL
jgi:hypothetical protein